MLPLTPTASSPAVKAPCHRFDSSTPIIFIPLQLSLLPARSPPGSCAGTESHICDKPHSEHGAVTAPSAHLSDRSRRLISGLVEGSCSGGEAASHRAAVCCHHHQFGQWVCPSPRLRSQAGPGHLAGPVTAGPSFPPLAPLKTGRQPKEGQATVGWADRGRERGREW